MYELCPETDADTPEIEALMDVCFAPGRTALSSYRLRDGVPKVTPLCLCLRDSSDALVAAIRYWPARVAGKPVLLLGPVAVHPTTQGEGLGAFLMRESLARAADMGWHRVMLVGDAPYYSRFGFQRLDGVVMPPPTNPDRVLGLELVPQAWVDVRGDVVREDAPAVHAALAEIEATVDLRQACIEVEAPKETAHDRTRPAAETSRAAADH